MAATNKDQDLRQVQSKIKSVKNTLAQLKKQQVQATAELKRVEVRQGKLSYSIQTLNEQQQQAERRLDEIRREMLEQNNWLQTQKSQLAGQVKSAYALGRQEQLKLLFNQQDAGRTSRIMTYYQYFNKARLDKLARLTNSLQLLNTLEQEKQLEKQELSKVLSSKKQQQKALEKTTLERKKILAKIKKEYRQGSTRLSRLKKDEQQLKHLITRLQQATRSTPLTESSNLAFHQLKGKLPWPIKGKIIRSFGSSRSGGKWNGTLIKAKKGNKIKAVAHGQVVFSDWFKGYGLLVIIKHDSKYISLYAFNQSLYKNVGDWVETGDTLATVGNSGGRKKPGLYFEIRRKDKPVNPKKWCKKRR